MRKRKKKIRFSKRSFRAPSVSASDVQPVTKREKKKEKKRLRKWKKKPRSEVHRMPAVVVKRVGPAHHIEKEYFEASYRATRKGRGFYPSTKALRWTRYYKKFGSRNFYRQGEKDETYGAVQCNKECDVPEPLEILVNIVPDVWKRKHQNVGLMMANHR